MKILLLEDDLRTSAFICSGLKEKEYLVDHVDDGEKGLFKALTEDFDVIITDIMMPGLNGFDFIKKVRQKGNTVPILILSAKGTLDDRVKGIEIGGDDYLVKPFAFSELIVRLQALIRRQNKSTISTKISVADLSIDFIKNSVYRNGEEIILAPLEYNLLNYFMRNMNQIISKKLIMEQVWGYNFDPGTNVVEARICKLRDKIDKNYEVKLLHTVRGLGYILEDRS